MSTKIFSNQEDAQMFLCKAIAQRVLDNLSLINMKEDEIVYHFINYSEMMLTIETKYNYVKVNLKDLSYDVFLYH